MKNKISIVFTLLLALFIGVEAVAQIDRSVRPEAGPAPEITIGEHQSFTLDNGLKVIVVENHKIPRVSYQLRVDVDPVMEKDAVGYVNMAGNLLRSGTKNKSKQEIDEQIDFIGGNLSTYGNGIYASSLTKHSDKLLELMSDVLLNPIFPEEELEKSKKQTISGLAASKTRPSAIASRVAQRIRYGDNHPYGEIQTEEKVENITRDHCVNYYNTYYKPNTSYLVIVGDINLKEAKAKAEKYFASWEKGEVPAHEYEVPQAPEKNKVVLVHQDGAVQSVINVTYPLKLTPAHEDVIPVRLTNDILGGGVFSGRLMQNLREDKGYTYGARSSISTDELVGYFNASAEVGTDVTPDAVNQFLIEMRRMRDEKVSEEHLNLVKNVRTGSFARSLERPQTIASFALNTERYNLPKDYYANYLKNLNTVSVNQVQKMAKKYILPQHSYILIVGDKEKLMEELKDYSADGEVLLLDDYGNQLKEKTTKKLPEGITAQKVIDKYVEAIGGKEKLQSINDITMNASTVMNGMEIKQTTYQKAPNKYAMKMNMNGNVFMEQKFDGEKGKMKSFQGQQEITGEDLENLKIDATLNAELKYDELGVKISLVGIESIRDKEAFKVKVVLPTGKTTFDYYDAETGLKIQSKQTISNPQGEFTQTQSYLDYQAFNGVKFPTKIKISGVQNMELNINTIEINTELANDLFE